MPHIYDKFASRYEKMLHFGEKRFLRGWRRQLLADLPSDGSILEIGAGTGLNFEFLKDHSGVFASEISIEMLKVAADKMSPPPLVQCDAQWLPFPDSTLNAVFCTLVFCSIPQPERALAEVRRVLKPDGLFLALEHVRPNGILGPAFDAINLLTVPLIEDHFNRKTADLVAAAGFAHISVENKALGIVNLIKSRKTQD